MSLVLAHRQGSLDSMSFNNKYWAPCKLLQVLGIHLQMHQTHALSSWALYFGGRKHSKAKFNSKKLYRVSEASKSYGKEPEEWGKGDKESGCGLVAVLGRAGWSGRGGECPGGLH